MVNLNDSPTMGLLTEADVARRCGAGRHEPVHRLPLWVDPMLNGAAIEHFIPRRRRFRRLLRALLRWLASSRF